MVELAFDLILQITEGVLKISNVHKTRRIGNSSHTDLGRIFWVRESMIAWKLLKVKQTMDELTPEVVKSHEI